MLPLARPIFGPLHKSLFGPWEIPIRAEQFAEPGPLARLRFPTHNSGFAPFQAI